MNKLSKNPPHLFFLITLLTYLITTKAVVAQPFFPMPGEIPLLSSNTTGTLSQERSKEATTAIPSSASPTPIPCPFVYDGMLTITCGTFVAPESRNLTIADSTNSITLTYAIAHSPNPQADPIFYLDGGPGSHTLDRIATTWEQRFDIFIPERDVIFIDFRGIGYSDTTTSLALNPLAYNSREIAADVHDLVLALGIDQVNLFGISYGTRIAQTIMREYPSIVRSAVLDGVVPIEIDMFADAPLRYDIAFDNLFSRCEETVACNVAYPNLRTRFFETANQLSTVPAVINNVYDRYQNRYVNIEINNEFLIGQLFQMLYKTTELNAIPGHLNAAVNNDYSKFINNYLASISQQTSTFNSRLHWLISCNDDGIFSDFSRYVTNIGNVPPEIAYRYLPPTNFAGYCSQQLGVSADTGQLLTGIAETVAINSNIPTLLTSGEFDPVTPSSYGDLVAAGLSNSTHITFPVIGHSAINQHSCPDSIFTQFIATPTQTIDESCVSTMLPFFGKTYSVMMPMVVN